MRRAEPADMEAVQRIVELLRRPRLGIGKQQLPVHRVMGERARREGDLVAVMLHHLEHRAGVAGIAMLSLPLDRDL